MTKREQNLPSVETQSFHQSMDNIVWLRIAAFLSTRSPNTRSTYEGILKEWCSFLGAPVGSKESARLILRATDIHASAYRQWLMNRPGEVPRAQRTSISGSPKTTAVSRERRSNARKKEGLESTLSNATIAKKFAALRRIYRMLLAADLNILHNPFDVDRVPPPSRDSGKKRPTEMVDFTLVKKIISSADASTPKGLRDQAILSALFGGALRRSEVAAIRIADVRRTQKNTVYLYLRATKAKRDAEQALPTWAASIIAQLVEMRRKEGASDGDYLFVGYTGQAGVSPTLEPISPSGIYKLFKHYCGLAGAGRFCTPHSARATAITRLLAAGIPHREVQEFSRHSSVQMVELYDKRRISVDNNPGRTLEYDDE